MEEDNKKGAEKRHESIDYLQLFDPKCLALWIIQDCRDQQYTMNRRTAIHCPGNLLQLAFNCNRLLRISTKDTKILRGKKK
jgi:hypothetical protein